MTVDLVNGLYIVSVVSVMVCLLGPTLCWALSVRPTAQ